MDEARIDRLSRKVGGRFKLASLVMKRLVDINRGSQPLVEAEGNNLLYSALKEIEADFVRLVPRLTAPRESEDQNGPIVQEG
ncbi:MAG TPA: DNA-directed RNA polymerase subunit omega [Planctomycetota bacterium]|nr:DNA-directed RNA polymerase subunit omega [Planctomycetota bacterium]